MSHTLTVEEAAARLADLLSTLEPGEEINLVSHNRTIAKIIPQPLQPRRRGGACKGMLIENPNIADDAHLADFKEFME